MQSLSNVWTLTTRNEYVWPFPVLSCCCLWLTLHSFGVSFLCGSIFNLHIWSLFHAFSKLHRHSPWGSGLQTVLRRFLAAIPVATWGGRRSITVFYSASSSHFVFACRSSEGVLVFSSQRFGMWPWMSVLFQDQTTGNEMWNHETFNTVTPWHSLFCCLRFLFLTWLLFALWFHTVIYTLLTLLLFFFLNCLLFWTFVLTIFP